MVLRRIDPQLHFLFDVVTIIAFAIAPEFLGLSPGPSRIAYSLAAAHAGLTMAVVVARGSARTAIDAAHPLIELCADLALLVVPPLVGSAPHPFFLLMGAAMFGVWLLSDYGVVLAGTP